MHFFLFLIISLIYDNINSESNKINSESHSLLTNELNLTFGHTISKRDNFVLIYFNISNSTLKEYQFYYFNFRSFGTFNGNENLPRQRLLDTHNSLRIVGLHEGNYVLCLSFINAYEKIFNPRYACYEFTFGEKILGSHNENKSNYLALLLFIIAFVLHIFIAIIHYIKSKNYAQKLLHRFINVTSKRDKQKINFNRSLRELDKELDHPHISASVQRRLSRVTIDVNNENELNHRENSFDDNSNNELPLYTLPHRNRRISLVNIQTIPEDRNTDTIDSALSVQHLIDSTPWIKRTNRTVSSSSITRKNSLRV
ncbi:unnamed protein product [Rotaria sordida]|uniref:Uncharacterized protein n=1 Tax=Rotaria sordida TaxID=392033 RepID=A0A815JUN0_9BILA|nr:unnamed protein product [Rotaria sordida]CAF1571952.1 unnamed protein product [Rotaria sordida]